MNWKLILLLSLFGLAMGVATVFFIPSHVEPFCWLVIFILCAYLIATQTPDRRFAHGLLLGIANSVWITAAHVLLFDQYVAHHAAEAQMMKSSPISPRLMMLIVGPVIGVISGIVIGLFAMVAGKFVRNAVAETASPA